MAWIKSVDESEWSGDLAKLNSTLVNPDTGRVDNILAIHSLDTGSLRSHLNLYVQAMQATASLPKVDREMIALVVSKINDCVY